MADITRTVGATTGSSSTFAAALTWMQNSANYNRTTDDVGVFQLVDAQEFNESNLDINGFTGAATSTKYIRIECTAGVRHDGTYNTAKARVRGNTNGEHVFVLGEDFIHVRHLAVQQNSTGSSDECFRVEANNK